MVLVHHLALLANCCSCCFAKELELVCLLLLHMLYSFGLGGARFQAALSVERGDDVDVYMNWIPGLVIWGGYDRCRDGCAVGVGKIGYCCFRWVCVLCDVCLGC